MLSLDPESKTPLYEQLYALLADEIRTGARAPGTPLPGRRTMAQRLGVSVNTVDAAYQMLEAEGLAEPQPRRGFFVQETGGMLHARPAPRPRAPAGAAPAPRRRVGIRPRHRAAGPVGPLYGADPRNGGDGQIHRRLHEYPDAHGQLG